MHICRESDAHRKWASDRRMQAKIRTCSNYNDTTLKIRRLYLLVPRGIFYFFLLFFNMHIAVKHRIFLSNELLHGKCLPPIFRRIPYRYKPAEGLPL